MKKGLILTFGFMFFSIFGYNQVMVGLETSIVINALSKEGFYFEFNKKKAVESNNGDTIVSNEFFWRRLDDYGLVKEYKGVIFEEIDYYKGYFTLKSLLHPNYGYITTYYSGMEFRGFFVNKEKICYFIKDYTEGYTHFTAIYTTLEAAKEMVTPEQYSKLVAMSLF